MMLTPSADYQTAEKLSAGIGRYEATVGRMACFWATAAGPNGTYTPQILTSDQMGTVPAGATELVLSMWDEGFYNNLGEIAVTVEFW